MCPLYTHHKLTQQLPCTGSRIFAGTAADNQCINGIIIAFQIGSYSQRAHAVSKHIDFQGRVLLVQLCIQLADIFYQSRSTRGTHVAQISFLANAFSMTAMIMQHTQISQLSKILHKIRIPLLVLRHAVHQLDDCAGCAGGDAAKHGYLQRIRIADKAVFL